MLFANHGNMRLRDVVFPGNHDAGIYKNQLGPTFRAQILDIAQQAVPRARYFDLRVATVKSATGQMEL